MPIKLWTPTDRKLTVDDLNGNFESVLDVNVYNEDLSAYTNGSEVTFATFNTYKPGTLRVYAGEGASGTLNRQMSTTDYTEGLNVDGLGETFSFSSLVLSTGSKLLVDYSKGTP